MIEKFGKCLEELRGIWVATREKSLAQPAESLDRLVIALLDLALENFEDFSQNLLVLVIDRSSVKETAKQLIGEFSRRFIFAFR